MVNELTPRKFEPEVQGTVVTQCYDIRAFHGNPGTCDVQVIAGPTNLWLYCKTCKVVAHIDQVTRGIVHPDVIRKERKP